MKQITLAVLLFANAENDTLPASIRRPLWNFGVDSFSWTVSLLPHLGEQSIYDSFDFQEDLLSKKNETAASTVLPILQCPSTPGYPRSYPIVKRGSASGKPTGAMDYRIPFRWRGPLPSAYNGHRLRPGETYEQFRSDMESSGRRAKEKWHGPAPLRWTTDGLSRTTALFETAWLPVEVLRSGELWIRADDPLYGDRWFSWAQAECWCHPGDGLPINSTNRHHGVRFALHPNGVNNAKLDGSVKFLSEDTALEVLTALDSRAGGETISDEY